MANYCDSRKTVAPEEGAAQPFRGLWRASAVSRVIAAQLRKLPVLGIALAIFSTAAWQPAVAQQVVPNGGTVVVTPLSGFEAPGISVGEFSLRSQVTSGITYDSNVTRTHSAMMQDYIYFVAPSFDLTRDGGNHIENVTGGVSTVKYAKYGNNDFTNIALRAGETYLLSPSSQILLNASIDDGYEGRVSSNHDIPGNAASPVHHQGFTESIGYRKAWQYVDAGSTVTFTQMRYDDVLSTTGEILNQTYRDADTTAFDAFLNIRHSNRIRSNLTVSSSHSEVQDRARSVDTQRLAGTITVDLTSKTSVNFLAAVSEQDYFNNPAYQAHPLAEYEASLLWNPMQRLTFTARGGYNDVGVDFTRGIDGGGVSRHASLDMTYLIWRNLQLASGVTYDKTHLSGGLGTQTTFGGRAALTYEFSSYAGMSFLYTLQKFESTSTEFTPYDESIFQTSLNLRF